VAATAPDLYPARLAARGDVGGGLVRLAIDPPAEIALSYERPGQYVVLSAGGKNAYFVLAGDPGETTWELVVRPGGEAAEAALAVSPGGPLDLSGAQGAGFPMDEARGQELIVAVTGSGIAAGRPVVRTRIRNGEARATELLLGVRTVADVPMEAELGEWSRAGVQVTICLSRQEAPGYSSGYVQDVARRDARSAPTQRRLIFAAGVKPMIEGMRQLAQDLGVHERDVRTNY
jgi:NAD(P)H-flavin reductase